MKGSVAAWTKIIIENEHDFDTEMVPWLDKVQKLNDEAWPRVSRISVGYEIQSEGCLIEDLLQGLVEKMRAAQ
jgi:hypothetical protein